MAWTCGAASAYARSGAFPSVPKRAVAKSTPRPGSKAVVEIGSKPRSNWVRAATPVEIEPRQPPLRVGRPQIRDEGEELGGRGGVGCGAVAEWGGRVLPADDRDPIGIGERRLEGNLAGFAAGERAVRPEVEPIERVLRARGDEHLRSALEGLHPVQLALSSTASSPVKLPTRALPRIAALKSLCGSRAASTSTASTVPPLVGS